MFSRSLADPNHPRWAEAPHHNDAVSRLLNASFRCFLDGVRDPLAYAEAHRLAAQCVPMQRSTHQNMLVSFALGLPLWSMNYGNMAIEAFADALDSAYETHDFPMVIELNEQLGTVLRWRGRFEESIPFYEDGLMTLHAVGGAALLNDPVALQLQRGLAVSLTGAGRYDEALLQLPLVRELAHQTEDIDVIASVELTTGNTLAAQGNAHAALPYFLAARDANSRSVSEVGRMMYGRMHAIAAGALLDVAEVEARRGHDVRNSTYVELAGSFARQALDYAAESNGLGARFLGVLAHMRHDRISGRLPTAVHLLTPLLSEGERCHDPAVAVQVYTAIGQDFAARGEWESARSQFQRAVQGANEQGMIFLGEHAKRELFRGSRGDN
jgi:tetratricopeptide (TPR) repeat protein